MQSVNVRLQPQANKLFDCLIALGGTGTSVYYFFTNQLFCCFVYFLPSNFYVLFVVLFYVFTNQLYYYFLFIYFFINKPVVLNFHSMYFALNNLFLFFKVFTSFVVCSDMSIMQSTDQLITGQISGACFAD